MKITIFTIELFRLLYSVEASRKDWQIRILTIEDVYYSASFLKIGKLRYWVFDCFWIKGTLDWFYMKRMSKKRKQNEKKRQS